MRFITFFLLILSMASSRAQNVNDKLFGGEYTYIEFVATKPHQYPGHLKKRVYSLLQ